MCLSCRYFKGCFEVTRITSTPGKRSFVYGYTKRFECSAIGSSTKSELIKSCLEHGRLSETDTNFTFRDREWFVEQINDQLGKYFELTFGNVCPEKRSPVFGKNLKVRSILFLKPDLKHS